MKNTTQVEILHFQSDKYYEGLFVDRKKAPLQISADDMKELATLDKLIVERRGGEKRRFVQVPSKAANKKKVPSQRLSVSIYDPTHVLDLRIGLSVLHQRPIAQF